MSSAERGQEVVESLLVGQVYGGELQAHLVAVSVKQVVVSHSEVEKMAGRNTGWIVIIVFRTWRWDRDMSRTVLGGWTQIRTET